MDMKALIEAFPSNIAEGLNIANATTFRKVDREIHNIVICGMGGSGIGGMIVSQWLEPEFSVPVTLCQDYSIPNFVSKNTLVIASSYSGNTEETIMSVEQANKKGAYIIGVTSGGKLQSFCESNGMDCVLVPGGNPPRSALAYSLVQLVNIFVHLDMVDAKNIISLENARQLILNHSEEIHSEAKKLAEITNGRVPIFYSVPQYEGIAYRAKQQFNENSKMLCWPNVIPEMNHNELVGWGGGDDRFTVVFLDSGDLNERNRLRAEITLKHISTKTDRVHTVLAKGNNAIEKSLYLINIIDWASFYSAEMRNVDAIEIVIIDYLKDELSKL
jgi:glucose/mannose-6-phosphate isomerase